jgi:hypothetical protein
MLVGENKKYVRLFAGHDLDIRPVILLLLDLITDDRSMNTPSKRSIYNSIS